MTTVRSDLFTSCCSTRACRKNRPASSPTTDTKLDIEATLIAALETIGKAASGRQACPRAIAHISPRLRRRT
jgi:hypothetical protein